MRFGKRRSPARHGLRRARRAGEFRRIRRYDYLEDDAHDLP